MSLTSLVDQGEGKGPIISLGEAETDEGDKPLDDEEKMHFPWQWRLTGGLGMGRTENDYKLTVPIR